MAKYLYGASVQGIQGFIFQTNKLAEIVGASELVEQICTTKFLEVANIKSDDSNIILAAAGNIKCVFDDNVSFNHFVKIFPKTVMQMAPGITISQAVVKLESEKPTSKDLTELEIKLKAQRNNVPIAFETGFMSLERARRTGGIAFLEIETRKGKKEIVCEATYKKLNRVKFKESEKEEKANESLFKKISNLEKTTNKDLAFDISDITASGKNAWIAVIHADGNGLGNIIQNCGEKLIEAGKFKQFSEAIESATKKACQTAFEQVIVEDKLNFCKLNEKLDEKKSKQYKYPIRPIVLGGDDLTIIIRADLALEFTRMFLENFEKETNEEFKNLGIPEITGLTACAGIAYVKEAYPLHYALNLAEELCKDAKEMVRADGFPKDGEMVKSSVAFFKVQDSFVEKLVNMKTRTMKAQNGINYDFGPYLLHRIEGTVNLEDLNTKLKKLKVEADKNDKSKGVSKLRQLVSNSFKDTSTMKLMKDRMKTINEKFYGELNLDDELKDNSTSMLYDLIQLHGFNY